jgi:hypothetical protein
MRVLVHPQAMAVKIAREPCIARGHAVTVAIPGTPLRVTPPPDCAPPPRDLEATRLGVRDARSGRGPGASPDGEQSAPLPCELHSRRSRQECPSCAEAGVAAEPARARASDDEQERRLRVLLLDEGCIATTEKAEGCRWGRAPTRRGRSRSAAGTQKFQGAGRPGSPAEGHLPTADASRRGHDCPVIVR